MQMTTNSEIEKRIEQLVFSGEIENIRPTAGKIGQARRIDDALGRYVEPEKRDDGLFVLDFNNAYNPACAYSEHYNCPIPPRQNRLPIAVTLDYHTNLSADLVDNATVITGYKTYPHVDMYEAGMQAAGILVGALDGAIEPVMAWGWKPLLASIMRHAPEDGPSGDILAFVSRPAFDPNLFVEGIDSANWAALNESPDKPMLNRPLRGAYPPGSTIKPFVYATGLDFGMTPATMVLDGLADVAEAFSFDEERPGLVGPCRIQKVPVGVCVGIAPWN